MAVRSEREKSKMQEKYQAILSQMLKEEDNKYCVDCDAKSPRWASWNIGVFICIRCAGFHRNLGVHISKVKSVNLDSWTGEQIASMQVMGNSRARAVYEANLPDGFRRPQADSTLESFIRAKYEQRKWIAKEWIPPAITVPIDLIESDTHQRQTVETKSGAPKTLKNIVQIKPLAAPLPISQSEQQIKQLQLSSVENNTQDLLNLDDPIESSTNYPNNQTNLSSTDVLDPLSELFATMSTHGNSDSHTQNNNNNNSAMMSTEKIMALFNTPQSLVTSGIGTHIRPVQTPLTNHAFSGFNLGAVQHSPLVPPQKSMSFSSNLHRQGTNVAYQPTQNYLHQANSGINYNNSNTVNSSNYVTSTITHAPSQFNNQFFQSTNTRNNPSTTALMSNMQTRPVTEYMSASSDTRWQ